MNANGAQNACRMKLAAATAADLMTPSPISIRHDAPLCDAVVLMTERRINAAPVINDAGRPVGVIAISDVLIHHREFDEFCSARGQRDDTISASAPATAAGTVADATIVGDIMTPAIITVELDTPAQQVVEKMVNMKVNQLFVADTMGTLAGVITPLDVLRRLNEE